MNAALPSAGALVELGRTSSHRGERSRPALPVDLLPVHAPSRVSPESPAHCTGDYLRPEPQSKGAARSDPPRIRLAGAFALLPRAEERPAAHRCQQDPSCPKHDPQPGHYAIAIGAVARRWQSRSTGRRDLRGRRHYRWRSCARHREGRAHAGRVVARDVADQHVLSRCEVEGQRAGGAGHVQDGVFNLAQVFDSGGGLRPTYWPGSAPMRSVLVRERNLARPPSGWTRSAIGR